MNIAIPGMGEYVSEFKRVMVSPPIDEITWSRSDDGTYINIEVTTHNMNTDKLYCKWNFYENWESNSVYTPFVELSSRFGAFVGFVVGFNNSQYAVLPSGLV